MRIDPLVAERLDGDCMRLRTDRSLGMAITGGIIILSISAPFLSWIGGASFPSDYDIMAGVIAGYLVGLSVLIRGIIGPWSTTDLPRVAVRRGLLFVEDGGHQVAYPLEELGRVWMDDKHRKEMSFYTLHAENLPQPLATSFNEREIRERLVRLESAILAFKLRPFLLAPDPDGSAFRGADPLAIARQQLDPSSPYRISALGLLLLDPEPLVRQRARTLFTSLLAPAASGTARPDAA